MVVFDDLGAEDIIGEVPPSAERIYVGSACPPDAITLLLPNRVGTLHMLGRASQHTVSCRVTWTQDAHHIRTHHITTPYHTPPHHTTPHNISPHNSQHTRHITTQHNPRLLTCRHRR